MLYSMSRRAGMTCEKEKRAANLAMLNFSRRKQCAKLDNLEALEELDVLHPDFEAAEKKYSPQESNL
jgi:hypothetical protein